MFSKACEYGLQAILFIAMHEKPNQYVGLKEISSTQQIPHHFLSKILQLLVKHRILNSVKGPRGGFSMNKPANELTLLEIIAIIDGMDIFERCGIGLKSCTDSNPCPVHHEYKEIKEKIRSMMSHKTVKELIEDVKEGKAIVTYTND